MENALSAAVFYISPKMEKIEKMSRLNDAVILSAYIHPERAMS